MTKQEIIIFNELIKQTVKSVVKETIKEELETINKSNKKDLREVKLLLAKVIKEGIGGGVEMTSKSNFLEMAEMMQGQPQSKHKRNMNAFQTTLDEALAQKGRNMPGGFQYVPKQTSLPTVAVSGDAMLSGAIPEFDAPIPAFSSDFDLNLD